MLSMSNDQGVGGTIQCSFCGKPSAEVEKMIAGPAVNICNECVDQCTEMLAEKYDVQALRTKNGIPTPQQIVASLDEYVISQDAAKKAMAVAMYNHYKRLHVQGQGQSAEKIDKSNILLLGPTGTGKTYLAQNLAKIMDVPFAMADATNLTQAGYIGQDVETVLERLLAEADWNVEKAQRGIVYIDEVDKIGTKRDAGDHSGVSTTAVQQALLKMVEGTDVEIKQKGQTPMTPKDSVMVDTREILFIVGGAFVGLENILRSEVKKSENPTVGFTDAAEGKTSEDMELADLMPIFKKEPSKFLSEFGMIPEFIGRMPVVTATNALSVEDLSHILTKPKNALVKQYRDLVSMDGVKLEFTDNAIAEIAKKAQARGTGARGLRSIMEEELENIMFQIPSKDGIDSVVINKAYILNDDPNKEPEYRMKGEDADMQAPKKKASPAPKL
jgi:ATP-dependent Clp protease ATP-binding subunit ClpX